MKGPHHTPEPAGAEEPRPRRASPACPSCAGTGFESLQGPDGLTRVRRCGCQADGLADRLLRQARIPRRYAGCSFESYDDLNSSLSLAKRQVRKFVEEYPIHDQGLLLLGTCGVGKTHLATAALQTLIREKGVRGLFCDFRDLLKEIQAAYNSERGATAMDIRRPVCA